MCVPARPEEVFVLFRGPQGLPSCELSPFVPPSISLRFPLLTSLFKVPAPYIPALNRLLEASDALALLTSSDEGYVAAANNLGGA